MAAEEFVLPMLQKALISDGRQSRIEISVRNHVTGGPAPIQPPIPVPDWTRVDQTSIRQLIDVGLS